MLKKPEERLQLIGNTRARYLNGLEPKSTGPNTIPKSTRCELTLWHKKREIEMAGKAIDETNVGVPLDDEEKFHSVMIN